MRKRQALQRTEKEMRGQKGMRKKEVAQRPEERAVVQRWEEGAAVQS